MSTTITAYLQVSDVETAIAMSDLIEMLDDPNNPTGTLNTTLLSQLITRVQGMMDSKIGVKYALPLVVQDADAERVTEALLGHALSLFRWLAIKDKSHATELYQGIEGAYNAALHWLDDVSQGKAFLGASQVVPGSQARDAGVMSAEHKGKMSRERLRDW
jgi:phage gp36-like protein